MTPLIFYLLSLATFFLGIALGARMSKKHWPWLALLSVPVGLQILCTHRPDWGWALFHHSRLYFHLEGWIGIPTTAFLLGAGVRHLKTPFVRDALLVAMGSILVFLGFYAHAQAFFDVDRLDGTADSRGICLQSTGSTCAPSAAVMLLHRYDIAATEKDMARRCDTTDFGTSMFRLSYGIQGKLKEAGRAETVRLRTMDIEELRRLDRPCIVKTRFSTFIDHVMLVLDVTPEYVTVADPLEGPRKLSRPDFMAIFKKDTLYLE